MALCERCGSIEIVRAHSSTVGNLVALVTRRKLFLCRRCGWRARRAWDENDRVDRSSLALDSTAAYDPDLAALDESPKARAKVQDTKFDLGPLDQKVAVLPVPGQGAEHTPRTHARRRTHGRRKRSRQREIIGAVAITGTVMFIVVMLGLSGSCSGASSAL